MARSREFDEQTVLTAAAEQFWRRGYDAVSVRDLAGAINITVASLYNAFGDKRSLYRSALKHYLAIYFGGRLEQLEGGLPPRQAIGTFFEGVIERSVADHRRKGCLVVNAAVEVASHDAEVSQIVTRFTDEVEGFFHRCVEAGQCGKTIATSQPAADIAKLLLGILLGLRVLARIQPKREMLEGLVRPAFALLDGAA